MGERPEGLEHPRTIRSYVRRTGRVTSGQAKAFEALGERFIVPFADLRSLGAQHLCGPQAIFGLEGASNLAEATPPQPNAYQRYVLEIGFGMGEATAQIAQTLPDVGFIACEVHEPGVGALLKRMGDMKLSNIRIIQHDVVEVLAQMLAPACLDGVHIFFPDPWHKKKHNKRRLIQPPFVAKLVQHIKPGGYLHCATDWQPYAEQMLAVLSAEPTLANTSTRADGYADKPDYRPLTKFENRGLRLGHGVWDLVFKRSA
jgi:tRNA (guanine-N7-)-methyltransferase